MTRNAAISLPPKTVIGHRANGRPIFNVAGGSAPLGEPDPVPVPPAAPAEPVFTAADIEKARKEEKDKLYRSIETIKSQNQSFESELSALRAEREAREAEETKRREAAEAQARSQAEEKLSAKELIESKLNEVNQTWAEKFAQIEREREQERVVAAKEREFGELRAYIGQRVGQVQAEGSVAPELLDLISGNTPEEVESSITLLQAKTDAIVKSVEETRRNTVAAMPGVSTAGYATTGPLDSQSGTQTFSAQDIAAMDMQQYAAFRAKAGIGKSAQGYGQGLLG